MIRWLPTRLTCTGCHVPQPLGMPQSSSAAAMRQCLPATLRLRHPAIAQPAAVAPTIDRIERTHVSGSVRYSAQSLSQRCTACAPHSTTPGACASGSSERGDLRTAMPVERREEVVAISSGQPATGGNPNINGRRQPSRGGTSRMNREVHVRFCERLGVKFPWPTRRFCCKRHLSEGGTAAARLFLASRRNFARFGVSYIA